MHVARAKRRIAQKPRMIPDPPSLEETTVSQIYRIFIRHESEAQPAYIKIQSDKSPAEIMNEIQSAMQRPEPSMWSCVDVKSQSWIFRADKIYTVCIYPPEAIPEESSEDSDRLDIAAS